MILKDKSVDDGSVQCINLALPCSSNRALISTLKNLCFQVFSLSLAWQNLHKNSNFFIFSSIHYTFKCYRQCETKQNLSSFLFNGIFFMKRFHKNSNRKGDVGEILKISFLFRFCWEIISFIYFPFPLSIREYEWNAIDKHFLWGKNMNKFYFMGSFESVRYSRGDLARRTKENYWKCWLGTGASHCNLQMYFMVQQVILFHKTSHKNWCCEEKRGWGKS